MRYESQLWPREVRKLNRLLAKIWRIDGEALSKRRQSR